jgi:hypothetical protein
MRAYFLNDSGHIVRGEWIESPDDGDVRRLAEQLLGKYAAVEIWQQARRLVRVELPRHCPG